MQKLNTLKPGDRFVWRNINFIRNEVNVFTDLSIGCETREGKKVFVYFDEDTIVEPIKRMVAQ